MRFVPYALGLCLGLGSLACSNSATTATTIVRPELVAVSPDDFLGGAECSKAGGVQSYVATLFDVTHVTGSEIPNPGIMLQSSPPTSCLELVTFGPVTISADEPSVKADHSYLAEVDAYEHAPDELLQEPAGNRSLTGSEGPITPLWTATCGGYLASPGSGGGGGGDGGSGGENNSATGAAGDPGTAGNPADDIPGLPSYAALTQTAHNCVRGRRTPPPHMQPASN